MSDTIDNLILDLLEWLARDERSYRETTDAWRTSCPRLTVWEDANERGFVELAREHGRLIVCVTASADTWLAARRPQASAQLSRT